MQLQNRKVVIIGAGHVGSHAGFTLIAQGLVDEIVYIDVDEKKAQAQALDLTDSTAYLPAGPRSAWAPMPMPPMPP